MTRCCGWPGLPRAPCVVPGSPPPSCQRCDPTGASPTRPVWGCCESGQPGGCLHRVRPPHLGKRPVGRRRRHHHHRVHDRCGSGGPGERRPSRCRGRGGGGDPPQQPLPDRRRVAHHVPQVVHLATRLSARAGTGYCRVMAPVRVRGCVDEALLARGAQPGVTWPDRLADASRRQNGPRKSGAMTRCETPNARTITERLSSKSCLGRGPDALGHREKVSSGTGPSRPTKLRPLQQASVGTKTRSAGRVPASRMALSP
jgi:hypothetical protein